MKLLFKLFVTAVVAGTFLFGDLPANATTAGSGGPATISQFKGDSIAKKKKKGKKKGAKKGKKKKSKKSAVDLSA